MDILKSRSFLMHGPRGHILHYRYSPIYKRLIYEVILYSIRHKLNKNSEKIMKQITFQMGKLVHAEYNNGMYKIDRRAYSTGNKVYPYHAVTEMLLKHKLEILRITPEYIYARI